MPAPGTRTVTLRNEHNGSDHRYLDAHLNEAGDLIIHGHDFGPGTAPVSGDGEYEWFRSVAAVDLPRLVQELGGIAGENILDVLERDWTGRQSYDLERILRETDIPIGLSTWNG